MQVAKCVRVIGASGKVCESDWCKWQSVSASECLWLCVVMVLEPV